MIKITDKWHLEHDEYNWTLIEIIPYKDKDGNNKTRVKKHYYGKITQALEKVFNQDAKAEIETKEDLMPFMCLYERLFLNVFKRIEAANYK